MTHLIYTTMRPDQLLEVDDAEYADLAAQHLILTEAGPAAGEATGNEQAAAPSAAAPVVSHVPTALDAAETLAQDQPADPAA